MSVLHEALNTPVSYTHLTEGNEEADAAARSAADGLRVDAIAIRLETSCHFTADWNTR